MKSRTAIGVLVGIVIVLGACVSGPEPTLLDSATSWPTEEWETSLPEAVGMSSDLLARGIDEAIAGRSAYNVHHLSVVRRGKLVLDVPFYPYDPAVPHDLASITKSVTSLLFGIAARERAVGDITAPVSTWFPEARDTPWDEVSAVNLLEMRSGFRHGPEAEAVAAMQMSENWIEWALSRRPNGPAGSGWFYNSIDVHLLSAIIGAATDTPTSDYAAEKLFGPLGIIEYAWPADPQGVSHGWGDLHLRPRDLARVGLMVLHGGAFGGSQVVPREWLRRSTTPGEEFIADRLVRGSGYGYLWWITEEGHIQAIGRGGQLLEIVPELELVIVMLGGGGSDYRAAQDRLVNDYIVAAVSSDEELPERPSAVSQLQAAAARAAAAPLRTARPPGTLPAMARQISGRPFSFEANPLGIESILFDFPAGSPDLATLRLDLAHGVDESGTMDVAIGLDGNFRFGTGRFGNPVRAQGRWTTERSFEVELDEIAGINRWRVTARFDSPRVDLVLEPFGAGDAVGEGLELIGTSGRR